MMIVQYSCPPECQAHAAILTWRATHAVESHVGWRIINALDPYTFSAGITNTLTELSSTQYLPFKHGVVVAAHITWLRYGRMPLRVATRQSSEHEQIDMISPSRLVDLIVICIPTSTLGATRTHPAQVGVIIQRECGSKWAPRENENATANSTADDSSVWHYSADHDYTATRIR